ncbi:hypothetical protein J2Z60_000233 [Lactobacillus colini]|uniref:MacB-like periplasmic core domain-containing protein n=1 Tax=Lactobacillus colini TaxID=1819254 RepID=A0ABS4MBP1_9LACO|nr:hypothetical protein [Lactobacillus colini]MBP2057071.1 hypothetical protein [Lactobacillus colini]
MKLKKVIIFLISLLCFIGLGITLSIQQSQQADQVLNNNGLSTKYYVYTVKKQIKVKNLLDFLNKTHNKHLQVHLKSKYDSSRILIWANYDIPSQPLATTTSRYFTKSDFDSQIPLAVISAQTQEDIVTFQGHRYLKEDNDYITIIGQLKSNSESENSQKVYYLTTGIYQPTADEFLGDYLVSIDGLNNKQATNVRKFLGGKQEIVDFAKTYNRQHGINPTKKFLFALLCVIIILGSSVVIGILDSKNSKIAFAKKRLFKYLIKSNTFKYIFANIIAILAIFLVLQFTNFFSNNLQLFNLYAIIFVLQCCTYSGVMMFKQRKDR